MKAYIGSTLLISGIVALAAGCNKSETANSPMPPAPAETAAPAADVPPVDLSEAPAAANPTSVVVTVNGKDLTRAGADKIIAQIAAQQGIPPQMMGQLMAQLGPKFEKQAVEQFIDRTLVDEEAKRRDIKITDADVDKVINTLSEDLPEGLTLEKALEMQGMSMDKLRGDVRENEMGRKVFEAETASVPEPDDAAVKAFYEENTDKFTTPEQAHARHILIGCKEDEGEEARAAAKAKAEDIRKQLLAGGDFAALAKENSSCPSKDKGGDLGTFGRGQMVPAFEEAAFTQPTNQIGEVVETSFGYHVVEVLDRTEGHTNALEKVADDIKTYLKRRGQAEAFRAYTQKLREDAKIVYPAGDEPAESADASADSSEAAQPAEATK